LSRRASIINGCPAARRRNHEEVAGRVGAWYATLDRDTVVTAHGGTARALVSFLGFATPDEAVHHTIDQGVVYVFADRSVTQYE
jgi:broad specificity phosphatase PhoE